MSAPCSLCNDFERRARDYRVAFTCDMAELSASSGQGCRICALILEGISYFESFVGGRDGISAVSVSGPTMENPYNGRIQVDVWLRNQSPLRLEFFHDKGMNIGIERIGRYRLNFRLTKITSKTRRVLRYQRSAVKCGR